MVHVILLKEATTALKMKGIAGKKLLTGNEREREGERERDDQLVTGERERGRERER